MRYGEAGGKKYLLWGVGIIIGLIIYTWITSPMIVTVTGIGEVSVPASTATVSFSISASGANPADAITAVKTKAESLKALLINSGIAESDVAEAQVQVIPASSLVQGASGYQAVISMGAKTVHVSDTANLISNLYSGGANFVSQPVISVENQDELEQKAVDEAMKDAKRQGGEIARKNWKFIKKIVAVSQTTSPTTSTVTSKADITTQSESPEMAGADVFRIVKAVSVSYKMW